MMNYTVQDLRKMCREKSIKGFSRKRKPELLELLGLNPSSGFQTTEKVIRDVYDALFPECSERFRNIETRFTTRLRKELQEIFERHHFQVYEKRGQDFILMDGKRLSVRGSLQSEYIYPERIGNLPLDEFQRQFGTGIEPKSWIIDHVHILLPQYLEQTFGDYLLWINEKTAECRLFIHPQELFFRDLIFSQRYDQWKIKNSIKTEKKLLGEFFLTDTRIKFRFKILTLIRLLKAVNG